MSVDVHLLGAFEAAGRELPSGLRGHLLAYLAYAEDWVAREQLAFLFWPDLGDEAARRNLRQVLNRLKSVELPVPLTADSQRLRWNVTTDVAELRRAVGVQDWPKALELYRGDLLAGWNVDGISGFGEWLELERGNLIAVQRRAALAQAALLAGDNLHEDAAAILSPLLSDVEPDEELVATYMRNAYLAGDRHGALAAYRQLESLLRMEFEAEPLPETRELVRIIMSAEPLGDQPARPSSNRVPLAVQRPPRMIGREAPVRAVLDSKLPLVIVRGEAGVGKSRLLEEVAPNARRLRCLENLRSVPYQPFVALLEELADTFGAPDGAQVHARELARLVPQFAPGTEPADKDPETARGRLLQSLAAYLELALAETPGRFQLVVDDLQWADTGTLEVLTVLAQHGRLSLLGACRKFEETRELSHFIDSLVQSDLAEVVDVLPLDEEGMAALVAHMMDNPAGAPLFSNWLHQSSAGNVMFALETLKSLFEAGSLRSSDTGWQSDLDAITHNYSELQQPPAIADVIARRTSKLGDSVLRTVQAASVLGQGFDAGLLAKVTDLSEWELLDNLESLSASGLVAEGRFRHDLIRQSVYAALTPERLRVLHSRAAAALAESGQPLVIAEHQRLAGDIPAATASWLQAASRLRDRGLYDEARKVLQNAMDHALAADAEVQVWHLKADLCATMREMALFEETRQLAHDIIDNCPIEVPRAIAYENLSSVHMSSGNLQASEDCASKGLELARRAGEERLSISIATLLAAVHVYHGRFEEAARLTKESIETLKESGRELDLAMQQTTLGTILDSQMRSREALPLHEEALHTARRLGARRQMLDIILNLLICQIELDAVTDEALELAAEALAGPRYDATDALRNNLAYVLNRAGRSEQAVEQWRIQTTEALDPTLRLIAWSRLARYHHARQDSSELRSALAQVRELSQQTEFPVGLASAAHALLECGEVSDLPLARQLAERTGYDPANLPVDAEPLAPLFTGD